MRVLFLATYFPKPTNPTMGVWALKEAQQLQRAGAEVRVISFTSWVPKWLSRFGRAAAWVNCPPSHDWNGLHVDYPRWPFYQVGLLKSLWHRRPGIPLAIGWRRARHYLRRVVRDWRPDVIFAHHGAVNGYLAERLYAETQVPYVVKDYDFYEVEDCSRFRGRRKVYQRVCRNARAMLSASRRMKDATERLFPESNVIVHHNGADSISDEFVTKPRPTELRNKVVISSGGIFYHRKAMPQLVRAFAELAKKHDNVVLRIFGDGQDRPEVEAIIRDNHLQSRVTLLGFLSHCDVQQELVWSDFFALIGWDEPFATVFLEAMSASKPIVCANDGGINDVVVSGKHGLTVPPRDLDAAVIALDRMIADVSFRLACGAEAKTLFETRLSAHVAAANLLKILQAAADRRTITAAD